MKYLELALQQVSCDQEPGNWAAIKNEIGEAYAQQPDPSHADFRTPSPSQICPPDPTVEAVEKRIRCHEEALARSGPGTKCWLDRDVSSPERIPPVPRCRRASRKSLPGGRVLSQGTVCLCGRQQCRSHTSSAAFGGACSFQRRRPGAGWAGLHEALTHFEQASRLIDSGRSQSFSRMSKPYDQRLPATDAPRRTEVAGTADHQFLEAALRAHPICRSISTSAVQSFRCRARPCSRPRNFREQLAPLRAQCNSGKRPSRNRQQTRAAWSGFSSSVIYPHS